MHVLIYDLIENSLFDIHMVCVKLFYYSYIPFTDNYNNSVANVSKFIILVFMLYFILNI